MIYNCAYTDICIHLREGEGERETEKETEKETEREREGKYVILVSAMMMLQFSGESHMCAQAA